MAPKKNNKKQRIQDWVRLSPLGDGDGARLLKSLGAPGSQRILEHLSAEVHGHPLSLMLMGTYIRDVPVANATDVSSDLPAIRMSMPAHVQLRIRAYEHYFDGKPHRDVLRILGLFDRPATKGEIRALRESEIKNLSNRLHSYHGSELEPILNDLRRAGLLNEPSIANRGGWDAHPLIREYFSVRLQTTYEMAWRAGHTTLYEHLQLGKRSSPPSTLPEMMRLYQAIKHAALADRVLHEHSDACLPKALKHVYWKYIQDGPRGRSHREFGAFQSELNMLADCFSTQWTKPKPGLCDFWHAHVLGIAGSRLRALGRLKKAKDPLRESKRWHEDHKHNLYAAIRARHLCELHLELGELDDAVEFGKDAVKLADRICQVSEYGVYKRAGMNLVHHDGVEFEAVSNDSVKYEQLVARTVLGAAHHQKGELPAAEESFKQARESVAAGSPWGTVESLFGLWGFRYCEYLIDVAVEAAKTDRDKILDRLDDQIKSMRSMREEDIQKYAPEGNLGPLGSTLTDLVEIRVEFLKSGSHLDKELVKRSYEVCKKLRKGKRQDFIPLGILNYVQMALETGKVTKRVKRELADAKRITKSSGMRLYYVDCLRTSN
jgi:tetratricopeptide (TPR) repeat protein